MANAWITFLKKYYEDRKKKQPGYSYRNAMKDAKKEYNGHSKSSKRGGTPALVQPPANTQIALVQPPANTQIAGGAVADSATAVPDIAAVPAAVGGGRKSRRRKGKKSARKSKKSRKSRSSRK